MKADSINLIHKGKYLSYYEIKYSDEDGNTKTYEMVSKTGSEYGENHSREPELTLENLATGSNAIILVVLNKTHDKMLISKEFRLGVNKYVYNFVAGLIDTGETYKEAGARELREETGLTLTKVCKTLAPTYTCAPVTDDITVTIICEAEGEITGSDSVYEEIHSKWYTKEEAEALLNSEDILFAARTQAFVYMWCNGGI